MTLADEILRGDIRSIARGLSWVEDEADGKERLIDALFPHCGRAAVWGITGPPGSGKSTLVDQMVLELRKKDRRVGVIAVDPSSPFSGGAILGDRLRMQRHASDDGVFIRSMASRGHLGGVSGATGDAIKILDAAGFDPILIETIGVGQNEIEIMSLSDLVLLVLVPGLGDEIQVLKAGIMEIGDVFVINKSDREEALKVKTQVEYALSLKYADRTEERNPIVMTSATQGIGIDVLLRAVEFYTGRLMGNQEWQRRRRSRLAAEIHRILRDKIESTLNRFFAVNEQLDKWVDDLMAGRSGPYALIHRQLDDFLKELHRHDPKN